MIYRMSKSMFAGLSKAVGSMETPASEKQVMDYMNQTFGLIQEVTELRLI